MAEVIHPYPVVIQVDFHFLQSASVVKVTGASVHTAAVQLVGVAVNSAVPLHGPSDATYDAHVTIFPERAAQV